MYIYTTKKEVVNCLIIKKIFKKCALSDYDLSHGYVINLPVKILLVLRNATTQCTKIMAIRESYFFMIKLN